MDTRLHILLIWLLRAGATGVALNEIRGLILAGPVIYGLYTSGGTAMAIWVALCSLAGIALSLIVPLFAVNKVRKLVERRQAAYAPVS